MASLATWRRLIQREAAQGATVSRASGALTASQHVMAAFGSPTRLLGARMVLVQHALGQLPAEAAAFMHLGVDPHDIHVVTVPYSEREAALQAVEALGVPARNIHRHAYSHAAAGGSYSSYQVPRVAEILAPLLAQSSQDNRPVVVMDDGAYVMQAAAAAASGVDRLLRAAPVAVVEQTARGCMVVQDNASALSDVLAHVPVVNVAESVTKKTLEPPHIAAATLATLVEATVHDGCLRAPSAPPGLTPSDAVLATGYGAIGKALATALRAEIGCEVFVSDPARGADAVADGFPDATPVVTDRDRHTRRRLPPMSAVVGCSGRPSFHPVTHRHLLPPAATLVSASSGNHELGLPDMVRSALGCDGATSSGHVTCLTPEALTEPGACQADATFAVRSGGGAALEATYLTGGFPFTFAPALLHSVPPHLIMSTHGCLVGGAMQAAATLAARTDGVPLPSWLPEDCVATAGLTPLAPDIDLAVLEFCTAIEAEHGCPLATPPVDTGTYSWA